MRHLTYLLVIVVGLVLALPSTADAKKKKKKKKKSKVTVPVDIGVAPTLNMITGAIQDDQTFHYGLKLNVAAIIDQATIKKYKKKIPKKYRSMALKMKEFRYKPSMFIPDTLYISPKTNNTGIYGVTFRPLGVGLSIINTGTIRLHIGIGAILTYMYIYYDEAANIGDGEGSTHFLRIGVDPGVDLEIKLSSSFLVSVGWTSQLWIPQKVGEFGLPDELTGKDSIWHNGQAYVMLHFRFPYSTTF